MPISEKLSARIGDVPLIICGPIVRRVEPEIVSVWIALKEPRDIELELYTGYCVPSTPDFPEKVVVFKSERKPCRAIGANLHISVAVIESAGLFTPGQIYSYNLIFHDTRTSPTDPNPQSLISLKQKDETGNLKGLLEEPHRLGFKIGQLPSFIVPPAKLDQTRIAHGSCRKPHGSGRDALAIMAKIIEPDFVDPDRLLTPVARPHYFFHTGDQIYADDCSDFLIQHYTDVGNFLLQKTEQVPFPADPTKSFLAQGTADSDFVWMQVTSDALPPLRRATNFYSGFTGDESNHLLSFAEFSAAYLLQWCDALWPKELPTIDQLFLDRLQVETSDETRPYLKYEIVEGDEDADKKKEKKPTLSKEWYSLDVAGKKIAIHDNPIVKAAKENYRNRREKKSPTDEPHQRELVEEFRKDLKAVRRVLANTANIMSFDDHDITDDWYMNGGWAKQALGTRLGETIIRNGLMAYALFQAWGNDPKGWDETTPAKYDRKKLLTMIEDQVKTFGTFDASEKLISPRKLIGEDLTKAFNEALGFANFEKPFIPWNCTLKISEAKVYVLDTRTRRDFSKGLNFPPNLIGKKALEEMIPEPVIAETGVELAIVVSGAPVLGIAAIESIGQPIIPKVLDFMSLTGPVKTQFNIDRRIGVHTGDHSLDVEHWSLHNEGFEAMLKRCAGLKKVLFLAGDVHYGITSEMDYWVKGEPQASRFVQMVSSSLKNIKPSGALMGILPSGIAELALSGGLNKEFIDLTGIGWEKEDDIKKIGLRAQKSPGQFIDARPSHYPLRIGKALASKPVLLTLRDWPLIAFKQNDARVVLNRVVFKKETPDPSFRWRMNVLMDSRPDAQRFASLTNKPANLEADFLLNENSGDAFGSKVDRLLRRSSFYSRSHINRFVNWYSHVAIIDFSRKDGKLSSRHSMFFSPFLEASDQGDTGTFEQPFVQYKVSLERKPATEKPVFPLEP
ncbi:hypothetical protein WBG78_19240 [Chryseolinea sp. T2]|uniref:hypothetical protein n=1 Tax=Chryseolinea sp. T2 TaxID=3129255 RepID=UPI0030773923